MKFYLTQRANQEIAKLSKKAATKNVQLDICAFFQELETIERIRNIDETLGPKGKNTSCKKSRLKNSINKEKSGGYRIYFLVFEGSGVVVISSVYSKKEIKNYYKDEIKRVFMQANEDLKNRMLIQVDILQNLHVISNKAK
jgi:mRNA-degrading endonuclease RelE of RelBE toxin-antitoxin system